MVRRRFLVLAGAGLAALVATLWPKRSVAQSGRAPAAQPEVPGSIPGRPVTMTTWWTQVHDGEWMFQSFAGEWCDDDWARIRKHDIKIAHFCEWSEVLDEEALAQLEFVTREYWGRISGIDDSRCLRHIAGA